MAEIGRWNGHVFEVSPSVVRSFTGLTIKGSSETKDKTSSKHKYVTRKNAKPIEVSLTVTLDRAMGCDPRPEAVAFVEEAYNGATDYFYIGSKKLVSCKLMLVDAAVKEVEIIAGGAWRRANVALTFKQADKYGETITSADKSAKTKKTSVKKSGTTTTKKTTSTSGFWSRVISNAKGAIANGSTTKKTVVSANAKVKFLTTKAKVNTLVKK